MFAVAGEGKDGCEKSNGGCETGDHWLASTAVVWGGGLDKVAGYGGGIVEQNAGRAYHHILGRHLGQHSGPGLRIRRLNTVVRSAT